MHTTPSRTVPWRRSAAVIGVLALALGACGGDDDTSSDDTDTTETDDTDTTETEPSETDDTDTTDTDTTEVDSADTDTTEAADDTADDDSGDSGDDASSGTYEPGSIGYRVVNSTDQTVDVYVRTTGLVEAFEAQMGVEPGVVTDFFYPPEGGPVVVTTAGAGDATCVATCDHILSNVSAFDDTGDVHTLLLHDAEGRVQTFDLYEDAPADQTTSNVMIAADPSAGQLVAIAIDLTDADFGLNLGFDGVAGCLDSINLDASMLVGGTQTPAYAYDGDSVDVLLYANDDRECAEEPVGGPFTVAGGPGTRTMLILTGSPGDMDAIIVPFLNSVEADASAGADEGGDSAATGDAATAYALMAEELSLQIGLPAAEAECLAPYVVDALGVDVALVDGELIDLEVADTATQDIAFGGIIEGVEACEIDPAILG